jgi:MarR family transcriptional regulator, transcriptional regulator for hemolysin
MARDSVDKNLLFTLGELARLVRAHADREAARYGITRAQWAVLAKVERFEGMKQSELAEQMEMQPITLTRLIDRLCAAATRPPAASTGFICGRQRGRCS